MVNVAKNTEGMMAMKLGTSGNRTMGKTLENTFLEISYTLLMSAHDDDELMFNFSILMAIAFATGVTCFLILGTIPYGKGLEFADKTKFPYNVILWKSISGRAAWILHQSPPLFIAPMIFYFTPRPHIFEPANMAAALVLGIHALHRVFIYCPKMSKYSQQFPLFGAIGIAMGMGILSIAVSHQLLNVLHFEENVIITCIISGFGLVLGLAGLRITWTHDEILLKLRNEGKGYQIPTGALFEYVSCPNYFGNVLQWAGCAIITRSLLQIVFGLGSIIFLLIRATQSHKFYKIKFQSKFPKERKIIIPFIY